jgi:NADH-quinone oxidoreductase subunit J
MLLDRLLFDFFAAIAAASALAMVTRRNILHAAILLLATLLATGGVFLQLQAEYAFVAQLLLFAGGVVLLFVLVVMLLAPESLRQDASFNWKNYSIFALALVITIELAAFFWARHDGVIWPSLSSLPPNNTGAISDALFRDDLLAFEFSSVPLLATIIGVVMLAKRRTE